VGCKEFLFSIPVSQFVTEEIFAFDKQVANNYSTPPPSSVCSLFQEIVAFGKQLSKN
jgi:hypothetical protein